MEIDFHAFHHLHKNSEHILNKAVEDAINFVLKAIEWNDPSSLIIIKSFREAVFKKYGADSLNYLDKQITKISSESKNSSWGGRNDKPMPVKNKTK